MSKAVILGASGPTGIHLAVALRQNGTPVRVVSRRLETLARLFPDDAIDKQQADMLDHDETRRAIEGCALVYNCIGLPGDRAQHRARR